MQGFLFEYLGHIRNCCKNALNKAGEGGFVAPDLRGKHIPKNKLPETIKSGIRSHIQSFAVYESHYTRNRTKKQYLGSELNIEKMYNLYKKQCEENGLEKKDIAKPWIYRNIFKTEFNLGFKMPSNDTCDTCDNLKLSEQEATSEEEKLAVKEKFKSHLDDAEMRYREKRNDKQESTEKEKIKVIMLDLQKCLPTPYLTNAKSFYLLKLWTLNLTIYDATKKKSYCLLWDESTAGRGGHEIASCIVKWASIVLKNSDVETLIIWSDNCPSQNRNIMMAVNYFYLLNICPSLQRVIHKFLLRGHTHMEADHVHALIERTIKKQPTMTIATPWDWQQLIRSTGADVINMELNDFKNFGTIYLNSYSPFVNRKRNKQNENFLISTAVWFEVSRDHQGILFYKCSYNDQSLKSVDFYRCARKKSIIPHELPQMHKSAKGITAKKHQHLIKMLEWIPSQFHDFYKNMPVSQQEQESSDEE